MAEMVDNNASWDLRMASSLGFGQTPHVYGGVWVLVCKQTSGPFTNMV